jgi:hypothetical protein
MLVFGGYRRQGGYLDELWAFRPSDDTWNRLVPEQPPSGRARHTAVWDPVGNRMLVLGGYAGGVDYYGDFWSYRPGDRAWQHLEVPGDQPGDRAEHVAVWDARDAQMLVMGGISADVYSELWSYKSPGARAGTPTEPPPVAATPSGPVLAPPTPMIAAPSVTPSSAVPAVTPSAVSKAPPKSTAGVR